MARPEAGRGKPLPGGEAGRPWPRPLTALESAPPRREKSLFFITILDTGPGMLYLCAAYEAGSLTQSVEYLPFKQRVARSSRARPTTFFQHHKSPSSSQVQDTGLSRRRHEFESRWGRQVTTVKAFRVFLEGLFCCLKSSSQQYSQHRAFFFVFSSHQTTPRQET